MTTYEARHLFGQADALRRNLVMRRLRTSRRDDGPRLWAIWLRAEARAIRRMARLQAELRAGRAERRAADIAHGIRYLQSRPQ